MKTSILIITIPLILFLSSPLFAQGRGSGMGGGGGQSPETMAQNQTDMMTERLGLTKDQIPQVYKINLESARKMITYRNTHRGDRAAMQRKMRELQREKEPALRKILNKEQWTKLQELHSENPGGHGPGYGRN